MSGGRSFACPMNGASRSARLRPFLPLAERRVVFGAVSLAFPFVTFLRFDISPTSQSPFAARSWINPTLQLRRQEGRMRIGCTNTVDDVTTRAPRRPRDFCHLPLRSQSLIARTMINSGPISTRHPASVAGTSQPSANKGPSLSHMSAQRTIVTSAARQRNGP